MLFFSLKLGILFACNDLRQTFLSRYSDCCFFPKDRHKHNNQKMCQLYMKHYWMKYENFIFVILIYLFKGKFCLWLWLHFQNLQKKSHLHLFWFISLRNGPFVANANVILLITLAANSAKSLPFKTVNPVFSSYAWCIKCLEKLGIWGVLKSF